MKRNQKHRIKSVMLVFMATCINALYLCGPLHRQFSELWHSAEHLIEAPNRIIGHGMDTQRDFHLTHEHHKLQDAHKHQFIDFVCSLFENEDTSDYPWKITYRDFSVDKHLISKYTYLFNSILPQVSVSKIQITRKTFRGFLTEINPPPKAHSSHFFLRRLVAHGITL